MTKAQFIEKYGEHKYLEHIAKMKEANRKRYHEDKEYKKRHDEYMTNYQKTNRAEYNKRVKNYQKTHREELKAYQKIQLNSKGIRLATVRIKSWDYLYRVLNHPKLNNYEIHHCFGYEDHTKFIYIPKSLHLKIHQYLRDNNINAKSNHFKDIVDIINESQDYTYIHM